MTNFSGRNRKLTKPKQPLGGMGAGVKLEQRVPQMALLALVAVLKGTRNLSPLWGNDTQLAPLNWGEASRPTTAPAQ